MERQSLRALLADESGATAIEYGLIVALIAVAMITALQFTGNEVSETMDEVSGTLAPTHRP